jgi:hypothetical protein
MQTSIFIPDIMNMDLILSRINRSFTIEDAYIVLDIAQGFPNSTIKVVNQKTYVYGKLCVFRSISISQIIDILNTPEMKYNSTFIKICYLTNNKMIYAFVIESENGYLESTSKIDKNKT